MGAQGTNKPEEPPIAIGFVGAQPTPRDLNANRLYRIVMAWIGPGKGLSSLAQPGHRNPFTFFRLLKTGQPWVPPSHPCVERNTMGRDPAPRYRRK
jgi:hypothetical protein